MKEVRVGLHGKEKDRESSKIAVLQAGFRWVYPL
jgi:hypothetical protein